MEIVVVVHAHLVAVQFGGEEAVWEHLSALLSGEEVVHKHLSAVEVGWEEAVHKHLAALEVGGEEAVHNNGRRARLRNSIQGWFIKNC